LGPKFTVFSLFSKKVLCQPQFLTYDLEFWICCGAGQEKNFEKKFFENRKNFSVWTIYICVFYVLPKIDLVPPFLSKNKPIFGILSLRRTT
jgi:hypothetical protein